MSNPFKSQQPEWEEVVDSHLECEKCGNVESEGKYFPRQNLLSWKCSKCEHISKIKMEL